MALDVLAALDKLTPPTGSNRPDNAFDCALAEYGCDGWSVPRFAVVKTADGEFIGLCPRRELHRQLTKNNQTAATIVARLAGLFRQANPDYEVGSKAKTKQLTLSA